LLAYFEQISQKARLTFLMRVTAVTDSESAPLGASRLGGTPDLPPEIAWPRNPEDDLLLDFIGQINLAQLPEAGQTLPSTGLISMYSQQDSASENPHKILNFDSPIDSLVRTETPSAGMFSDEDTDEPYGSLLVTEFVPSVSLPESLWAFPDFADEIHDAYSELLTELYSDPKQKEPSSRLLGYPFDPFVSGHASGDWELLAEIESHFHLGKCLMGFWDAGSLQLTVPQQQLSTCDFKESEAAIVSM
jgi:uncharacterized protein YwqG